MHGHGAMYAWRRIFSRLSARWFRERGGGEEGERGSVPKPGYPSLPLAFYKGMMVVKSMLVGRTLYYGACVSIYLTGS